LKAIGGGALDTSHGPLYLGPLLIKHKNLGAKHVTLEVGALHMWTYLLFS
jgi:hypothetical protein